MFFKWVGKQPPASSWILRLHRLKDSTQSQLALRKGACEIPI